MAKRDILDVLKDDVILISLYVDDRKALPVEEQLVVPVNENYNKKIETVGQKWAFFQQSFFKSTPSLSIW